MTLPKKQHHLFDVIGEVRSKRDLSYQTLIGAQVNRRDEEGEKCPLLGDQKTPYAQCQTSDRI